MLIAQLDHLGALYETGPVVSPSMASRSSESACGARSLGDLTQQITFEM
jgi:hypothetical protein